MKKKTIKIIIACLIVAVAGTGIFFTVKHFTKAKTTTSATSYMTTSVRKMNLEQTVDGTGTAYSAKTRTVTSNNSGTIKSLSLKVGDKVSEGDVIAKVYDSSLETTLDQAEDNLKTQKLKLTQLQTELEEAKTAKSTSSTAATSSTTANNTTSSDQGNQASSSKGNQTSSTQSTSTQSSQSSASTISSINSEISQQKITITQAERTVDAAQDAIDSMTIKAPITGIVTAVSVSNGDSVQNAASLLTITNMNSIRVKTSVDELDINKVKKGQSAEITFDAIDGKTYKGTVKQIAQTGTTSNNVTTYEVVVSVNSPTKIKLDMNATVTIKVKSRSNVLVIPADALVEMGSKKFVRVANSSSTSGSTSTSTQSANSNSNNSKNTANSNNNSNSTNNKANPFTASSGRLVEIQTGLETENYIEVTSGLTEGQQLLVSLPKSSTSTQQQGFGGMRSMSGGMDGMGGAPSGAMGGFNKNSSKSNSSSNSSSSK
ncbi:efflux RND transporter periplasmic adaptor subunit [Clostridium oryzae]|uniref:Macrolide export protein MacA n=1 Tax=Clostridium oryzae TaxID=1450648 RepID=A0A1V4ICW9_9CLOT|nr:HlyD family efflux transporter periplasmic adaptor subunit [Clostridium oryzae]OPJ57367.1 macrolide export protein MacA [Clostridium oryzae]